MTSADLPRLTRDAAAAIAYARCFGRSCACRSESEYRTVRNEAWNAYIDAASAVFELERAHGWQRRGLRRLSLRLDYRAGRWLPGGNGCAVQS